jgi:hypothetical protein
MRGTLLGGGSSELAAGADPALGAHLPQVPLNRPGTEEQLGADLRPFVLHRLTMDQAQPRSV